ncbi:MAG: DNA-directed RNA polymerase subunit omega [Rickettsiales bacterium]|nr:DNA-directed RNA polymerase subunit omega [Rickettsiales bacterium]
MGENLAARPISVEKCLDIIPNKFRLALVVMNRAKDVQMKVRPDVEVLKFARKSVNMTLYDIRSGRLDIPSLEEKIKKDLLTNNLFPKSSKSFRDDSSDESCDNNSSGFELKSETISDSSYEAREDAYVEEAEEAEEDEDGDTLENVAVEAAGDEGVE